MNGQKGILIIDCETNIQKVNMIQKIYQFVLCRFGGCVPSLVYIETLEITMKKKKNKILRKGKDNYSDNYNTFSYYLHWQFI